MKVRRFGLILGCLLVASLALAQTTPDGYKQTDIVVEEADGSPVIKDVQVIRFDNGTVTDTGLKVVTVDLKAASVDALGATQAIVYAACYAIEPGYILIGNGSSQAVERAMSGEGTISTGGVFSAQNIDPEDLDFGAGGAVLVSSTASSNGVAVTVSGDGTISTGGVFSCAGLTTNQQFLSAAGVTNTLVFTNGLLYAVQ